jgi:lysophospholipase L1-like esterase
MLTNEPGSILNGVEMIECMILGDSIARGTSDIRTECVAYAKSGINSSDWNRQYSHRDLTAKSVIISLGSNDWHSINTMHNLKELRQQVQADRVFWILPAIKPDRQAMIRKIAEVFGDTVIEIPKLSKDGVHPTYQGYKKIAEMTK